MTSSIYNSNGKDVRLRDNRSAIRIDGVPSARSSNIADSLGDDTAQLIGLQRIRHNENAKGRSNDCPLTICAATRLDDLYFLSWE